MHRFLGLCVLVAAATALPMPSENKLDDLLTIPSIPFTSSIMLLKDEPAKIIKAAPLTNVVIPSPQLRPVMIVGDEMLPKVEEALEMKDDPVIVDALKLEDVKPETLEMEKEEPKVETIVPEMPKEEIKKPGSLTGEFISYVKVPSFSNLLPTISWPNWSNILPIKWVTGKIPSLGSTRDIYYPKEYPYVLIKGDRL